MSRFESALARVELREDLTLDEAQAAMIEIIDGALPEDRIAAFLLALKAKGESAIEISGFVDVLKQRAITFESPFENVMDVCGTGGDNSGSFNISTTVAIVLAAAGIPIAKHGNRSVSSRSGSFDVIEVLALPFHSQASEAREALLEHNIAFLFAPQFHPAFAKLAPLRRRLGTRTVLNLLGPLLNPVSKMRHQLMGIYCEDKLDTVAGVLREQGLERALIVHGEGGVDEISLQGTTQVAFLDCGEIRRIEIHPTELGLKTAPAEALLGGDAQENAQILLSILGGETGARRDVVVLNAAVAAFANGTARDFREGREIAEAALDSGRALALIKNLQRRAA